MEKCCKYMSGHTATGTLENEEHWAGNIILLKNVQYLVITSWPIIFLHRLKCT